MTGHNDGNPLRLVYVHSSPVISETAGGGFAVHTAHALARQGARTTLIVGSGRPRPAAADVLDYYGLEPIPELDIIIVPPFRVPYTRVKWNGWFRRETLRHIRRIQGRGRLDAVICRNLKFIPRLMSVRDGTGTKLIYEPHRVYYYDTGIIESTDSASAVSRKMFELEQKVYREVDGLAILGRSFAEKVRDLIAFRTPYCIAPSGVAPSATAPIREREYSVCYSGQLHRHKGVELLIDAVGRMNDRQIGLLIVGGNDRLDEVRACAVSNGIAPRVRFTGHVGFQEAQRLLARTTLAAAPLLTCDQNCYYTSPLKLFEYMAMRVPVVASNLPAISEVITDGETGILVEPDDAAALARGLDRVLADRTLYNRVQRRAYEKVMAEYTWDARAKVLMDFAREL